MSTADIIRAWKDPEYRSTLGVLPTHPAGLIELADPHFGGSAAVRRVGFDPTNGNSPNCSFTKMFTKKCQLP